VKIYKGYHTALHTPKGTILPFPSHPNEEVRPMFRLFLGLSSEFLKNQAVMCGLLH
jgi:hypothetical protein